MGRIHFITIRIELTRRGYRVNLAVFDAVEVIRRESYEQLSWREAQQVSEALTDTYRPGLELLEGGVQESLF